MSRRVTPGQLTDGGIDVARHGDVDDQQRAAGAGGEHGTELVGLEERGGRRRWR